jgi:hypothetical protein
MNRREFMQTAGAAAVGAGISGAHALAAISGSDPMVGIQVGAVSFVDEGVEQCLDVFQRNAGVNTLFVATFTYGRGIAGRQIPGQPLPDHGKQQYDTDTFHGGCYTQYDRKYFANTVLKDFRAPDVGDFDVLEAVLPSARKRGLKTICWFEDVFADTVPNIDQVREKQLSGKAADTNCLNNPNYRQWLLGMVENWARSYDIDGIMWGSERQGAFANALETTHDMPPIPPMEVTCFCQFCRARAKENGIDSERAARGFTELARFVEASRRGQRSPAGHYVTLWRLMLKYPELLAWEMLWTQSLRDTYAAIHAKAKEIKPKMIICGYSAYSRTIDFAKFREIADEVDAKLMADVAHIAGLVVGGAHPSPFPHAHVVTTTTHKTLRGPRGGLVIARELAHALDAGANECERGFDFCWPYNHVFVYCDSAVFAGESVYADYVAVLIFAVSWPSDC